MRTSPARRALASSASRSTARSTSSLTFAVRAVEDLEVALPVQPGPVGADDLDLEVLAARRRLQLLDPAGGHDPAPGDDDDVLADVLDQVELVAGEDDADPGRGPLADDLGHRRDADRVEARERLVEDQQLRVVDQRGRELDALLVAVRQLLELGLGAVGEAHPLEPVVRGGIRGLAAQAVLLGEVAELLGDPHARVQAALLGHVPEAQPRVAVDRRTGPADLAAVRAGQAEDDAHRGGLAGAVGAEEPDDAARAGREAGPVERGDAPIAFGQVVDLKHAGDSFCRR